MTCVMRELNVLDASNNIDVQAMKRDIQKYTMPSEWFKNKYEHLLDTCYEMATNLPADIAENSVVTGDSFGTVKLGEVKMFTKCCEKAKTKLCMHQDIKKKVESNFGPMEDILHGAEVGLDLLLDVLVHAQLGLGLLAALGEHLNLAELDSAEGVSSDNGVLGDVSGRVVAIS